MQFKSIVLAVFAAAATSVAADDACDAGAILGIKAMCGTEPVDCGSGRCCLNGQKCVKDGSTQKCEDKELVKGYVHYHSHYRATANAMTAKP